MVELTLSHTPHKLLLAKMQANLWRQPISCDAATRDGSIHLYNIYRMLYHTQLASVTSFAEIPDLSPSVFFYYFMNMLATQGCLLFVFNVYFVD